MGMQIWEGIAVVKCLNGQGKRLLVRAAMVDPLTTGKEFTQWLELLGISEVCECQVVLCPNFIFCLCRRRCHIIITTYAPPWCVLSADRDPLMFHNGNIWLFSECPSGRSSEFPSAAASPLETQETEPSLCRSSRLQLWRRRWDQFLRHYIITIQ
jgi:hypothetical protein